MNNQGNGSGQKSLGLGTDKPYQMSVDFNKQVFLVESKRRINFNNDLVVGPQISGDTSASACAQLMVQLILEIGLANGRM